tara:strand:+ start:8221 stop:9255 length:1035 start_codon:yes stop_codon:yes gene_type:complete
MKKIITFGEIMMRLAPKGFLRLSQANNFDMVFGGSESNVGVSLVNFGSEVEFVTRLPKNDVGLSALKEMRKYNLGTKHIIQNGERLGIYFIETGVGSRSGKVLYDRSNSAMSKIKPGMFNWKKIFKDSKWFHWSGITPAISQTAADVCLEALKIAKDMGLTISTDLNYRSKLWDYKCDPKKIMTELTSYCDIIVANEESSKVFFEINLESKEKQKDYDFEVESFLPLFKKMFDKFSNAKKVVFTSRKSISASYNKWRGILYDGTKLYHSKKYEIKSIVDRIGAGDAFMAGLIYGFLNYDDDQKSLDFAAASCVLKHTISGDSNLVTVAEVEKLMSEHNSVRIER